MDLNHKFRSLLMDCISPGIKQYGFKKKDQSFYRFTDECIGLINFQRSTSSTKNKIIFTINLGICHKVVARLLFQKFDPVPKIWNAHWHTRLGHMMPENYDLWWTIEEGTDMDRLGDLLVEKISSYAIPEMNRLLEKDGLYSLWLSGKSPGQNELTRLAFIAVIEKSAGRQEQFAKAVENLRNHSTRRSSILTAESWIERLNDFK